MPAARKQTLWPRSSLAELGGFLSIAGACADGEVAPKAAVHSTGMKARAFNARLCPSGASCPSLLSWFFAWSKLIAYHKMSWSLSAILPPSLPRMWRAIRG